MTKLIGSTLVGIGTIWVTVSIIGIYIVGALLWLGIFIALITSSILWGILWLFIGGGLTAFVVSIVAIPTQLLGAGLLTIGERLKNPEEYSGGEDWTYDCKSCGRSRVSDDDTYCRSCGQPYG